MLSAWLGRGARTPGDRPSRHAIIMCMGMACAPAMWHDAWRMMGTRWLLCMRSCATKSRSRFSTFLNKTLNKAKQ